MTQRSRIRLGAAALALAACAAYANSFSGPFLFDDPLSTVDNPSLRRWATSFYPPHGDGRTVEGRPILNFSFAVNWHWTGANVWSYHLLNLLIHIAAACVLFGLVRRTLARLSWTGPEPRPTALAWVIALIWTVHPLQTEAVTYIAQRAESLMGLFYLTTLYAFARSCDLGGGASSGLAAGAASAPPSPDAGPDGARAPHRRLWLTLAWFSCFLGMGTKEIMVSAPVMVLLYDRTFVSGSFRAAVRNHGKFLLSLAATWLALAVVAYGAGTRGRTSGFGISAAPLTYYATQPRALVRYLIQCFWPQPLIFDYGTQWVHSAGEVVPYAIVLAVLLAAAAIAWWRNLPSGFLAAFALAILSVNSLIPGNRQTSAEHRMYLPLAAVVALVVCAGYRRAGVRRGAWLIAIAVLAGPLAAASFERNRVYRSAEALYRDSVDKLPTNAFARYNLGKELDESGRSAEAIAQYLASIRSDPGMVNPYINLGNSYGKIGRLRDAEAAYQQALQLDPNNAHARYELGLVYLRENRKAAAEEMFNDAVLINPDYAAARDNLGAALLDDGRLEDARQQFEAVVRQGAASTETYYDLGMINLVEHRADAARADFEAALHLEPTFEPARQRLRQLSP